MRRTYICRELGGVRKERDKGEVITHRENAPGEANEGKNRPAGQFKSPAGRERERDCGSARFSLPYLRNTIR